MHMYIIYRKSVPILKKVTCVTFKFTFVQIHYSGCLLSTFKQLKYAINLAYKIAYFISHQVIFIVLPFQNVY